ncbi:MAG: tetratricopeptide repeat protein [Candidatus Sumerlaeia bacterium]|nr:tetratricopeptide repeat protein [Candidatus Sumerlaeia bacterium]
MTRYDLRDSDYSFNASLDPFLVLKKMGFTENSVYQEGDIVRVHCPIHKDLVRKSLIIDVSEKTYRCQYSNCEAHEGGLLIELVALYYDCSIDDVARALFGQEDKSSDLLFRGEMFINQGRHNEALPYLEQACDLDPRNEVTRCKLAALYLELNRKDDAYREYLQAAESYAVRGELEKTLAIYNILIMLQPGAVKARKELAFLFSRMGRPDAAAEQIKWVVDFYLKYNQIKGAQEACEQLIELDSTNPVSYILLGKLLHQAGRRVPAMQNFEQGARLLLEQSDASRAVTFIEEALEVAPGSPRLKEMLEQAEARLASEAPAGGSSMGALGQQEEEFISWLSEVDKKLALGEEVAFDPTIARVSGPVKIPKSDPPRQSKELAVDIPLFDEMADEETVRAVSDKPKAAAPSAQGGALGTPQSSDSSDISPEDRRVAMCLNDMKELDNSQIEAMRQQLVTMFTDVRKTYEDGLLSDWEMRTIKDFYKAFCIAVDMHRRTASGKSAG